MSFNIVQVFIFTFFVISASGDQCFCPRTFDPVCASNGQVFNNICTLECYNLENHVDLQLIGIGHCIEHLSTSPTSIDQASDTCYNRCKAEYKPVVNTSKRKIYWNRCYYECDAENDKNKRRYYLLLLGFLCSVECAIVLATKFIRNRKHYYAFE